MSQPGGNPGGQRPGGGRGFAGPSRDSLPILGDFKMTDAPRRGPLMVLQLSGRLDGRAAQLLQQRCTEIRAQGVRQLALDLGKITFLASSGLGVFLAETEEFKEAGGTLHLVAASAVVSSVVNLLNVGRFLSLVPSVEDVLTAKESRL